VETERSSLSYPFFLSLVFRLSSCTDLPDPAQRSEKESVRIMGPGFDDFVVSLFCVTGDVTKIAILGYGSWQYQFVIRNQRLTGFKCS